MLYSPLKLNVTVAQFSCQPIEGGAGLRGIGRCFNSVFGLSEQLCHIQFAIEYDPFQVGIFCSERLPCLIEIV
ncbi:MAG: hypothetical protein ACLPX1_11275 [Steroidobacteraceae bacterium]